MRIALACCVSRSWCPCWEIKQGRSDTNTWANASLRKEGAWVRPGSRYCEQLGLKVRPTLTGTNAFLPVEKWIPPANVVALCQRQGIRRP